MKDWDGFSRQSNATFLALHSQAECDTFANLLINIPLYVRST